MEEYIRGIELTVRVLKAVGENRVLMGSVFFCNTKALVVFLACNPGPHMLKSC